MLTYFKAQENGWGKKYTYIPAYFPSTYPPKNLTTSRNNVKTKVFSACNTLDLSLVDSIDIFSFLKVLGPKRFWGPANFLSKTFLVQKYF